MVFYPEKVDVEAGQSASQDRGPDEISKPASAVDSGYKKEEVEEDSVHSIEHSIHSVQPATEESRHESKSKASSVHSRALTTVPLSQRRGLFAKLSLIPEVERPYDYANKTKWLITLIVSIAAAAAPLGSSIFFRKSLATGTYCAGDS
jgi:hypothetical protein